MSYSRDPSKDLVYDLNTDKYTALTISKPTHLYSWDKWGKALSGSKIIYTAQSTPTIGDYVFDNKGMFTGYTVNYIFNENGMISIEDCLVVFKMAQQGTVKITISTDDYTTCYDNVVSVKKGTTINYTAMAEGYLSKSGTILATDSYQLIEIDLDDAVSKSYQVSYDDSNYTAQATEGLGLKIIDTATTKTTQDLSTDFTITEV